MADKKGTYFDCGRFIARKVMTRKGLASLLDLKESTVGNWCSGTSTPNYSTIARLIELGITAEELFGRENADLLIKNSLDNATERKPIDFKDPEFLAMVKDALAEMKHNGQI